MVKEIVRDQLLLAQKCAPATEEDAAAAQDLLDTFEAHSTECVGLAANMIGVLKRIIVFENEGAHTLMYNPVIVKKDGAYTAKEGCLSLDGQRSARRWKTIKVQYRNESFELRFKSFSGFTAQIIQHEIDHCQGIII